MKSITRVLLAAAAVVALTAAGWAYPNLNATTGIVAVPNGYIVANGAFVVAGDILFYDDTTLNARALYGLTDRLEVGVAVIAGENDSIGVTAKYRLPVMPTMGSWALGISLADTDDRGSGTQAFIVATRPLTGADMENLSLVGSLGLTFTDLDDASGLRPFVGAQLLLPNGYQIDGEFELEAGDLATDSILSLVVRRQLTPQLAAQLGFTNATGFIGAEDHEFFLGVAYSFARP